MWGSGWRGSNALRRLQMDKGLALLYFIHRLTPLKDVSLRVRQVLHSKNYRYFQVLRNWGIFSKHQKIRINLMASTSTFAEIVLDGY